MCHIVTGHSRLCSLAAVGRIDSVFDTPCVADLASDAGRDAAGAGAVAGPDAGSPVVDGFGPGVVLGLCGPAEAPGLAWSDFWPESEWLPAGRWGVACAEHLLASDWADEGLRAAARADLVGAHAGLPASAAGAAALAGVDPAELPAHRLADYLVLADRVRSWAESAAVRGLAALERGDRSEERWSREQVMCSWRVSKRAAEVALRTARTLAGELPATLAALAAGDISPEQARAVAAGSWRLDDDAVSPPPAPVEAPADPPVDEVPGEEAAPGEEAPAGVAAARPAAGSAGSVALERLEAAVLPRAGAQTAGATRAAVEAAVLAIDPSAARQRCERAFGERQVWSRSAPDGMATVTALLRAVDAELVMTGLSAQARALPKADGRSVPQRRADLLLDAVLAGTDGPASAAARDAESDPDPDSDTGTDTDLDLDSGTDADAGNGGSG
ncbi:MAG: endonuclease, partial [Frankiales bacterium]|nr:endonuclease [Frankiales bacterium]